MRPWTRSACAQMVSEAQDQIDPENRVASEILNELEQEFRPELDAADMPGNTQFRMESIYSRTEKFSGEPLTDGYDFAQTQYDDFGRPYGEGWNTVNGFSAYATYGPLVVYVRGEGQTAPSIPALPLAAREFVSNDLGLPLPPATPQAAKAQFTLQRLSAIREMVVSHHSARTAEERARICGVSISTSQDFST